MLKGNIDYTNPESILFNAINKIRSNSEDWQNYRIYVTELNEIASEYKSNQTHFYY